MNVDQPEPLWREVVGDTEPWRRGRLFLILLAVWEVLIQCIRVGTEILLGRIEVLLGVAIGAMIFWLLYYFIWIGVHWVRWLSGGWMGLVAFANLIWGIRDGNTMRLIDGTIGFPIAAYLALAPSVYFFALRQKETVRWKESLAVAAVFVLLLASVGATAFGLHSYKTQLEENGRAFADRAFRRVFVDGDTAFFRAHVTERLMQEEGSERLNWFIADRSRRVGEAQNLAPAEGRLQFWYRFPATLVPHGTMRSSAESDHGPVRLNLRIGNAGGQWQIDAIWWRFIDPATLPSE